MSSGESSGESSAESSGQCSGEGSAVKPVDRSQFNIHSETGTLSADLTSPESARALLVLAHGAGAGFRHANMRGITDALAAEGVASVRFNLPFMEQGRRRVDSPAVTSRAIADAWAAAGEQRPDLPRFLGGHSFGGRMTSHAVLSHGLDPEGLIFCAFPLHPAGKPGVERATHLEDISCPMLFLSGTRDALAQGELLQRCVAGLPSARLHWLDDADHGYRVRKRVRKEARSVFQEMAEVIGRFVGARWHARC